MTTNKHIAQIAIGMTILEGFIAVLFIAPGIEASFALGFSPYPPSNESGGIPTAEPYPTPGEASQTPATGEDSKGCNDLKSWLPTDHVVAVSSDCQVSDFESWAQTLSNQYEDPNSHDLIMPPSYPHFKDISENGVEPLRVIGPDNRIQINDTTVFPWSIVVKIEGQWNSTDFFACTGWMLGPSTVVTAGHCVYNFDNTKTYAYNVMITPALNTDSPNPRPFGSCHMLRGWVLTPWYNNGDDGYDYGVYDLGCITGYQTGNPGMKVISGGGNGTYEAAPGYPGDKGGTTMWTSGGTIQESQTRLFFFDNDTSAGMSGGPIWVTEATCNPCVIAVDAQEYAPPTLNSGPRVTTEAFNFFITRQQFIAKIVYLPLCMK